MDEKDFLKKLMGFMGSGGLSAASALNPVTAAVGAIPQVVQLGLGIGQQIRGDKLARSTQRPVMDMPMAQQQALANARNLAMGDSPGLSLAKNQLAQSQAGSISAIQGSGGGQAETLSALTRLDRNAGDQALNLGAQQEAFRQQMMMNLQNQLMQAAETQQKQFLYNKDEPYRNIMETSQKLRDASNQNIHGALTGLGGTFASAITKGVTPDVDAITGGRLAGAAGSTIGTRQAENPTDTITANNQRIDRSNMGPQGEGPMNGLPSNDAAISDPGGLVQDPDGLINRRGTGTPRSVVGSPVSAFNFGASGRGIVPAPYNPNETGIQPTDNTTLFPNAPSLNAMMMDKRLAGERQAYFGPERMGGASNPMLFGAAYKNLLKMLNRY